jgi:hypothetical protein
MGRVQEGPHYPLVWKGPFKVQIHRCSGTGSDIGADAGSIRYDGLRYERCAAAIKQGIEEFFDGQLAVEIHNVDKWYVFDIRVVPSDSDANPAMGELVFSKTRSKRWPKVDEIIQNLQEFCQTVVRVHCQESCGHMVATARRRVELVAEHERSGASFRLVSNALNVAETRLFPGRYWIYCAPEGRHCGLNPDHHDVTSTFEPQDFHVVAAKKKTINFNVRDHFGKPMRQTQVHVDELDAGTDGCAMHVELVTDQDGKCGCRLELGAHKATIVACTAVEPCEVLFEVEDREMPQVFSLNARRIRFLCEVMVQTELGEPIVGCPFIVERLGTYETYTGGETTEIGLVRAEFLPGPNRVQFHPKPGQPYIPQDFTVEVAEDGSFKPFLVKLNSKESDVVIRLLTDSGEPAKHCKFSLVKYEGGKPVGKPEFFEANSSGTAASKLEFLTPYVMEVPPDSGFKYASQRHIVRADSTEISQIIARPLLGEISAKHASLVVDLSGTLQRDGGLILQDMVINALGKISSDITLDVVLCAQPKLAEAWNTALINAKLKCLGTTSTRTVNAGEALKGILNGLGDGFAKEGIEEVFVISDARLDREQLVQQLRWLHNAHPRQPQVHLVAVIQVDDKASRAFQYFRESASLTGGTFRLVRLRQRPASAGRKHPHSQGPLARRPSSRQRNLSSRLSQCL